MLSQSLGEADNERQVVGAERAHGSTAHAEISDLAHRHDVRREPFRDPGKQGVVLRPGPVDLVDKDERRHAKPLQGTEEHAGLRPQAFHRGDDQHGAV